MCAQACYLASSRAAGARARTIGGGTLGSDSVAGIDGGNHCYCGTPAALASAAALKAKRPLAECQAMACRGDPNGEKANCGGENRLIAYTFACLPPY